GSGTTCWICSDVRRRSIQRSISLSNQPLSEDVADFLRIPANPLFWKRATRQGGLLAIALGLTVWIWCEVFLSDAMFPPQLVGLLASLGAMVIGSLGPQWIRDRVPASEPVTQA
ncbi:hypothetical protein V4889_09255, partial [Ralstonia solanacearum species complex bacterium KE101]